jgi:hypothetical protein
MRKIAYKVFDLGRLAAESKAAAKKAQEGAKL